MVTYRSYTASVVLILVVALSSTESQATQLSVGIDHDMTKPTYGLQGQSSSQVTYDDRNGLNLKGTINDILGPPIKIATGFDKMLQGSNMAGIGSGLKSSGAILGFDAKLLEAAGGANLLKGGLLLGGSAAKTGAATAMHGPQGKKIASVIEMPVKVVAMKDLTTGKVLTGLGKMKENEAQAAKSKGANMMREGEALKAQGMNQVVQGATEGMQNIGNMVQQTAGNAATAFKLLPIILDLPTGQQDSNTKTSSYTQQQHSESPLSHQMAGGSLFGGLSSLLPGLTPPASASDPSGTKATGAQTPNIFNLFGGQNGAHNGYAAVVNSANPLTSFLMNPNMNPFLYPLATGPLGQSVLGKVPGGAAAGLTSGLPTGQSSTYNYNLFPGIKVSETMSSHLPALATQQIQQQQQLVEPVTQQQQQQQQTQAQAPAPATGA